MFKEKKSKKLSLKLSNVKSQVIHKKYHWSGTKCKSALLLTVDVYTTNHLNICNSLRKMSRKLKSLLYSKLKGHIFLPEFIWIWAITQEKKSGKQFYHLNIKHHNFSRNHWSVTLLCNYHGWLIHTKIHSNMCKCLDNYNDEN